MSGVQARDVETNLVPVVDAGDARKYRREFYIMCFAFGLNHATVTTPILYAASILTPEIGNTSNAVLYGATLVCSLFFANPLFAVLGPKKGLTLSMFSYTIYVFLFAIAASKCKNRNDKGGCTEAEPDQEWIVCLGAVIGGFGAGLLWTCQGAFYALVCEKLAHAEGKPKEDVTAELGGTFALIFLLWECTARASTTLLTGKDYLHLDYEHGFFILAGAALLSTIFFGLCASKLGSETGLTSCGMVCEKALKAVSLWSDPTLWLLQTTNITFGFAAAWLGGYVGPNILSKDLNASFIGFAGALLSGLAAVLAKVLAPLAARIGKGPVICLGSAAFLCLGIFSKFVGNPLQWGAGSLFFYVFMGIGRAVYESTNKAVFADFFPGEKSPAAFANVFVFGTASSTVAFLLSAYGGKSTTNVELYLLLGFAALTPPSYLIVKLIRQKQSADR
jgi:MFS family permease